MIAGIRLALEVLCPPGPVVVPLPCYPPFRAVVELAGRQVAPVALDPDAADAALDLDAVEEAFRAGARTLLLCNPHNPLGRVPRRDELEALAALASRYGARVVTDEIHGPLVLPGADFTPYLSVDEHAVLVTSPSKTFNTAGLHTAQVVVLDAGDQERLRGVPVVRNHAYSPLGMIAAHGSRGATATTGTPPWCRGSPTSATCSASCSPPISPRRGPDRWRRPTWPGSTCAPTATTTRPAAGLGHGVRVAPGTDYQPGLPGHVRLNIATRRTASRRSSAGSPRPCWPAEGAAQPACFGWAAIRSAYHWKERFGVRRRVSKSTCTRPYRWVRPSAHSKLSSSDHA